MIMMIFNNNIRRLLVFLTLIILPMNIRIILQSSILVEEKMVAIEPPNKTGTTVETVTNFDAIKKEEAIIRPSRKEKDEETEQEEENSFPSDENKDQKDDENDTNESESEDLSLQDQQDMNSENSNVEQDERILPIISSKDDPNTFAACLQIMDDNHHLIEWIAYHYHVMPMRRLIVLADPHSMTSPQHILDRWKDRMDITLWGESNVYPDGRDKEYQSKLIEHRTRQRQFVRRCLEQLHKEERSWVLLSDTDEYAMINERVRDPTDSLSPMFYSGKNLTIPSQEESGSILKFIQIKDVMIPHTNQYLWNTTCITVGRKVFGTKEEDNPETFMGFKTYNFQTLHWRRYNKDPRPGKSIVNLQRVKFKNLPRNPSIHRPFPDEVCQGKMWLPEPMSVIIINHYPSNLEQMLFRQNDARGSDTNATAYRIERFEEHKKFKKFKESYMVYQWLSGFIKSVGQAEAQRLLEHVGLPEEASKEIPSSVSHGRKLKTKQRIYVDFLEKFKKEVPFSIADPPSSATTQTTTATTTSKESYSNNSFSACLMVMDDNHFLIEWLAYHYHVMPLRRLIILSDPHSRTDPSNVLERWKDRINITHWTEKDVHPNGIPLPPNKNKVPTRLGQHRSRQRRFIRMCLQALHNEGRGWVFLTDTDEYIMISDRLRDSKDKLSPGESVHIPAQKESGSVMKALQIPEIVIPHTGQHLFDNPCITMSRKTFGTKPMGAPTQIFGFNSTDFMTLNWRYYVDDGKFGKTLINLNHITYKQIPRYPSVHRPLTYEGICQGKLALKESQSVFVTNHYSGNLQQMLFRVHDPRGNSTNATQYRIERFNNSMTLDKHIEKETIQEWLRGFFESVGEEEARRLLRYVGQPELAASPIENIGGR